MPLILALMVVKMLCDLEGSSTMT